jgi:hypothetical protein
MKMLVLYMLSLIFSLIFSLRYLDWHWGPDG